MIVGWIKDSTKSFELALYFLAGCAALSTALAYFATRATDTQRATAGRSQGVLIREEVKK